MFQQVFDMKQIDELAKAQLLWYFADYHTNGPRTYCFDGSEYDLPSATRKCSVNAREWKFFILLEE